MLASGFNPLLHAVHDPQRIPTVQPSSRPSARNQRVNKPNTSAGNVCNIHRPPSNCRSSAYCVGRNRIKASAPTFMTAAGTKAPIAIAENANPANQDGNSALNSAGTTSFGDDTLIWAA